MKSKRLRTNTATKEDIQKNQFKIEKNNLELRIYDSELADLKVKRMIFKYKLKEMYVELMKNPEKLM